MDIDLCSFGMCSEHTLICAETKGGQNVSCTCERGEQAFNRCCIYHAGVLTGGECAHGETENRFSILTSVLKELVTVNTSASANKP